MSISSQISWLKIWVTVVTQVGILLTHTCMACVLSTHQEVKLVQIGIVQCSACLASKHQHQSHNNTPKRSPSSKNSADQTQTTTASKPQPTWSLRTIRSRASTRGGGAEQALQEEQAKHPVVQGKHQGEASQEEGVKQISKRY
jgi:hypothetical protein